MTLVNTETGEVLDVESAERRASYICTDLDSTADSFEHAMGLMREAIAASDHVVLGYRSVGEYVAERFGGRLARLGVDMRREVVRELTQAGMSTRAIAPVVGVSQPMVVKDRAAAGDNSVITSQSPEGEVAPSSSNNEVEPSGPTPAPRPPVVGIDGKTYTQPAPRPQPTVAEALAEFPDLAYYAETGPDRDVLNMADDLRRFRERGELDMRLDNLRRAIAVDKAKRDGTYRPGTTAVMGADGDYYMAPREVPEQTSRPCPTCSGRGFIEE